jgi:glycerol-3-phosphate acyltransferase PlsY
MTFLLVSMITATLAAYLFGSIGSAIIVCKLMRLPDPRTSGSNNPGTTNVLRIGGKKAALLTLLGDVLKGLIPVLLCKALGAAPIVIGLSALGAFLGHLYPVFSRFQGGKGVATAFGCMLGLAWPLGLLAVITWLIIAGLFRYSSLAALVTAFVAPLYSIFFTPPSITFILAIMSLLLIYRHKKNIQNLVAGNESKLGQKSSPRT